METLQPKIRFPEFKEDWKIEPIGNYIELFSGIALKGEDITDDESGTPILRGINITEGFIRHTKEIDKYYLGDKSKIEKYFVKENDLVLGMDGSKVGKNVALITKFDEDAILIQRVARIRTNSKSTIKYIYQHIFSKRFHDYVDIVNTSSGIPHISSQQIKDFKIGFPSLQEQTRIANFLSSVDEKLNLLKDKKSLLEDYKKGIMQKIFNQEIRFKDDNGNDFEDWEEITLGELCEYKNGGSFEKYVCEDGIYNLISLNSIDINGKIKNSHKKVSITDNSLQKGDLIMVLSDVAHGNFLGLTDIVPDNNFVLNQRMGALKPKLNFNRFYLKTYINFNQSYFKLMGQGSSQQNLSKGDIESFNVKLPCKDEQNKIANFLSAIDEKIELVSNQIQDTQEYKKGLLQQMFV